MKRSLRRVPGFTLLEMVAVLLIVGLMLAFSPMALDALVAEKELEKEASRLGSMLEAIRIQSIVDQAKYAVHYDSEENRWAIQIPIEVEQDMVGREDDDRAPVKKLILEADVAPEDLDWHDLPKGFELYFYEGKNEIRKGRWRVIFDPQGTVPPHTIVLKSNVVASLDELEQMRTIKVNFPGFVSYAPGRVVEDFKRNEGELR